MWTPNNISENMFRIGLASANPIVLKQLLYKKKINWNVPEQMVSEDDQDLK